MTDDTSNLESPSVQKAADDLRAAAAQSASQVASSAEERARQLKESASKKAQQFREFAGEKADQVRDVAGDKAQQFKSVAGEQWKDTQVRATEFHSEVEDYVRQHPTKSLLTAAGVGLLFGLILRR